ncbi:uncharacterized protein METZ01_LOCUS207958 [marine metagenome]|uniref:Uncharacterized protein n=1 Tax=marine metagenome TaxID=408172 RepID=A0A382EYB6_9ZZZZ
MDTSNRKKFIEFLARNKSAAEFFINHISEYSNILDMNFIDQHANKLHWFYLSKNKSLPWSEALIERYKDKWRWGEYGLSFNKSLPWSEALIERYADKWDWLYLTSATRKVFNSWTKQEIGAALERIRSAFGLPVSGKL